MPTSPPHEIREKTLSDSETRTPFETVHNGILRALYEGRFVPGQRLAAPDLMRTFDAGRGTVREVLQRLAAAGVVTIRPNSGAQIRRLSRRDVIGILDVVEALLGLAAKGAAAEMQDIAVRSRLIDSYASLSQISVAADFQNFILARERYYRDLISASGNLELQRVFPAIQVQIMRAQLRPFDHAADSVSIAEYVDLQDAVISCDTERAWHAGRDHVRMTRNRIEGLPDKAFEPEK